MEIFAMSLYTLKAQRTLKHNTLVCTSERSQSERSVLFVVFVIVVVVFVGAAVAAIFPVY